MVSGRYFLPFAGYFLVVVECPVVAAADACVDESGLTPALMTYKERRGG